MVKEYKYTLVMTLYIRRLNVEEITVKCSLAVRYPQHLMVPIFMKHMLIFNTIRKLIELIIFEEN